MSTEENKAISRRADVELFDRGNLEVADELFAPNFVHHDPVSGEDWRGPESVKEYAAMIWAAFPDLYYNVEDQIAEGDKVATRYRAGGTHQGELMGTPPTGNRIEITGIMYHAHQRRRKIEEIWENSDTLGMMQQLGVISPP